jgi:hypothetical protein
MRDRRKDGISYRIFELTAGRRIDNYQLHPELPGYSHHYTRTIPPIPPPVPKSVLHGPRNRGGHFSAIALEAEARILEAYPHLEHLDYAMQGTTILTKELN